MKMNKNEYLRSMARHATLLCCIVPFIAAVSAKAEGSYSWDGSNNDLDNLQIELTQTTSLTSDGAASIALFDKSTFAQTFGEQLSRIDSNLPNYSNWALSSVLIEISGDVNGVSISYNGGIAGAGDNATLTVGNFVVDNTNVGSVTFGVPATSTITDGNPWTATSYNESTIYYSHDLTVSNPNFTPTSTTPFEGTGTATGTLNVNVDLDGVTYYPVTAQGTYPRISYEVDTDNPIESGVSVGNSLRGVNLTLNIKYIVTPEPGTMALLLTGIPLFLVRRRKSWKK